MMENHEKNFKKIGILMGYFSAKLVADGGAQGHEKLRKRGKKKDRSLTKAPAALSALIFGGHE